MHYRVKYRLVKLLCAFVPVLAWRIQIRLWLLTDEDVARQSFYKHFGYPLNLRNPVTWNEKLKWLMVYDRNPLMTQCADKYAVREYVRERCGGEILNELYGVYQTAAEIDFSKLPNSFVLKVNHGSGQNIIVTDKAKLNETDVRKKLAKWLKRNHYYNWREWCYKNIPPKIICEKYLEVTDGEVVNYKFHCFNGKPRFIQVVIDGLTNNRQTFYDMQWRNQKFTLIYPLYDGEVERPACFQELLTAAAKLSAPFCNVRVDFYAPADRPVFGEMTFYHGAGNEMFRPSEWDRKFGDLLQLPARQ